MAKKLNFMEDIEINKYRLDEEFVQQASLYLKYSTSACKAKRDMDIAKEELDILESTLRKDIKTNPQMFVDMGKSKKGLTNDDVIGIIKTQESWQEASHKLIEIKYKNEKLWGAVRAFEQRRSSLDNLVKLSISNYYATPQSEQMVSEEETYGQAKTRRASQKVRVAKRNK